MKLLNMFNSLSNLETALLVVFVFYLTMPIDTPAFLAKSVDSSMGMLVMFTLTVYLFFYTNPLIAILYVFVAYELLRRSSEETGRVSMVKFTPTQAKKDSKMASMNPTKSSSLEEDMVNKMAPIGHSDVSVYTNSTFKPVSEDVGTASQY